MQNSANSMNFMIDLSLYSLYAFYALIFLRWASCKIPVLSRTKFGIASSNTWVNLAFYGTLNLMILTSLLGSFAGSIAKDIFGPWQAWSIFSLIVALATLFPHFVVAVEFRVKQPNSAVDSFIHILMISLAFISIPMAMAIVNITMIWGDIIETHPGNVEHLAGVVRKYFILPENFLEVDFQKHLKDLELFWFDQTFQATLWNIPSTFGFKLTNVQPQPDNRFMSVLILINQFSLHVLSLFMVLAGPIKRIFNIKQA